ncbi:MAG: hypothetical protein KG028_04725 [Actinobacteria bacterium]|jgi:hypothetical protein|nr:hypothetical protein [Actinomycetota bacterium]
MAPHRQPAKRLLVAPVLLLAGILAVVITVPRVTDRPAAPLEQLAGLPDVVDADDRQCRRERNGSEPAASPMPVTGARVTSAMMVACPAAFDGRRVRYAGELVGDLLHRDGGAWVLVNDDDYALRYGPLPAHREYRGTNSGLSVWLPTDLLDDITGLGRPNQRGDLVVLDGHVRRTDPDDGGGLSLRADTLQIIRPAQPLTEPLDRPQAILAAASLLAAGVLWTRRERASP